MLEPGWLAREFQKVKEDVSKWPPWMWKGGSNVERRLGMDDFTLGQQVYIAGIHVDNLIWRYPYVLKCRFLSGDGKTCAVVDGVCVSFVEASIVFATHEEAMAAAERRERHEGEPADGE